MDRDETLMAYVDGELSPADRAAFERELEVDPALQAEVVRQKSLRARLSAAFDPVLTEQVPLELTLAAQAANAPRRGWRAPQWAAMAACLALGVLVGRAPFGQPGPVTSGSGGMELRGALAAALETHLAADPGPVRIGISFRSNDGRYCRTFTSAPDRLAGVACRNGDAWLAHVLAVWTPPETQYRTAASETPPSVLAAVDGMMAGEPLDSARERAARAHGWRP